MADSNETAGTRTLPGGFPEAVIAPRRDRSQLDFELDFYAAVLDRSPDFVDVLRCQAELLTRKGRHDEGLALDFRLAELVPDDALVTYNLACSLALVGNKPEAIAKLKLAVEQGYDDWSHLDADHDLDGLRTEAAYQVFVAAHRPS